MSTGLVIAGGALQLIGLSLVFAELAAIRAHEWGVVPPWTRLIRWSKHELNQLRVTLSRLLNRLLRRRRDVIVRPAPITAHASAQSGASLVITTGTGAPGENATDAERIRWLMDIAVRLDADVKRLREDISTVRDDSLDQIDRRDHKLRQEFEDRERKRRAQLRWSIRRQAIGAGCVALGLALATVGSVI